MINKTIALAALATVAVAGAAEARDQIRVVGSSTVYPFSSTVAENFGQTTQFSTPIVESTGTGGGMKLFCSGIGTEHPDFTGASRRMKVSELESCLSSGVDKVTELKIGYDGIVFANDKTGPDMALTREQLWMALAHEVPVDGKLVANPYNTWSDIDPSLPDTTIEVLGPPPTSGTRDAFVELVMEEGCQAYPAIAALEAANEELFEEVCATMREDGLFVEAGEDDNLIVQRLDSNPAAFGIFGFSFLDQNRDILQAANIDGVEPTFDNIASGDYPVSRSLFLYAKVPHIGVIPGMMAFMEEMTSEAAFGPEGYLVDAGLIPLAEARREAIRAEVAALGE